MLAGQPPPALSNGLKENAAFLGFKWAVEDPSGLHAIAWRDDFETHHGTAAKAKLVGYNADDCLALKNVAEHLQLLLGGCKGIPSAAVAVDDLIGNDDLSRWGQRKFAIGDFRLMADCAYFDHQRSKIYIRSSPEDDAERRESRFLGRDSDCCESRQGHHQCCRSLR
jgi:hypothetical protein